MDVTSFEEVESWLESFLWPEPDGRQRAKRARILTAATGLFVQYGYRKTSIDEVAAEAGVAKGTVYLYYRNKAELVLHAIALEKQGYVARLQPLLSDHIPPLERLQSLIALGLMAMMEMPLLSRMAGGDRELALALAEADGSVLERINGLRSHFMISLLDEIAGGTLSRQQLEERAQGLIDLIGGIATGGTLAVQGAHLEPYVWSLASTLVNGVAAPSSPRTLEQVWSPSFQSATEKEASL